MLKKSRIRLKKQKGSIHVQKAPTSYDGVSNLGETNMTVKTGLVKDGRFSYPRIMKGWRLNFALESNDGF